ncbi:hypothetical protein BsWGS_25344 [Bradybaena similaris]
MKMWWWLIAVYLTVLTRADDDALVFIFENGSIHYDSENLARFHNCLCDKESISCSVFSPFNDTLQSTKDNTPITPEDDDYINVYVCQFGAENTPNMVCSRVKSPATCDSDLCYPLCFTNRPSCDIDNVSAVFFFLEKTLVKMNAPNTLLDGFCQADEVCSPEKPCTTSASKLPQSSPSDGQFYSTDLETLEEGTIRPLYLDTEETDCSNVCPVSVAMVVLFDKAVVTIAVLLYVCSLRVW